MMVLYNELRPLFRPKSAAVVGASHKKGKIGYAVFENMLKTKGAKIYPVNPTCRKVLGRRCYASVKDLPGDLDLAVIAVPAPAVLQVMRECAEKGVKSSVIISSGFREIGNAKLEEEVAGIAKAAGMRTIGPNCLGLLDTASGLDMLFLPEGELLRPKRGSVALVSQSGAAGSVMLDWIAAEGLGVSKFISYGNAMDLADPELLEYLREDPATKVVCVYLEGTKDGRRLLSVGKHLTREKPVLILKAGKSEAGTAAVSSHTGSLAGSDIVYEAAFKQAGIIRTSNMREMLNYAKALVDQPLPKGPNVQIVTNGGGFGVLATDEVMARGLRLAKMGEETRRQIQKVVPPYAAVHNPLDLVGDADAARYETALKALAKDKAVDSILCVMLFQTVSLNEDAVAPVARIFRKKPKPIVVCSAGSGSNHTITEKIEKRGIPVFETPNDAADALWCLTKYSEIKKK